MTDLGKPTVAVVAFGRPQGLTPVIDRLPAVLTAYYGGPHQATAIADTATGATLPCSSWSALSGSIWSPARRRPSPSRCR